MKGILHRMRTMYIPAQTPMRDPNVTRVALAPEVAPPLMLAAALTGAPVAAGTQTDCATDVALAMHCERNEDDADRMHELTDAELDEALD